MSDCRMVQRIDRPWWTLPRGMAVATLVFFFILSSPTTARGQAPDAGARLPLQIEDLVKILGVGNPQVSPEGEWVAYTVSTSSLEPDKSGTRIWMVPSAGGDPIPMTADGYSASSPDWSPDGRYLSFMATRGDSAHAQVWVLDRRMGEGQQLTDEKWGINGYQWSPDGSKLLLSIRDPDPIDTLPAALKPKATPPWEIDRLQFKQDYVGYITGDRHTHLYVFDLRTKTTTQITSGDFDAESPEWSPDGTRVAFVANRTENPDGNYNSDIWVVDANNTDKGADPRPDHHQSRRRLRSRLEPGRRMDRIRHAGRAGPHVVRGERPRHAKVRRQRGGPDPHWRPGPEREISPVQCRRLPDIFRYRGLCGRAYRANQYPKRPNRSAGLRLSHRRGLRPRTERRDLRFRCQNRPSRRDLCLEPPR